MDACFSDESVGGGRGGREVGSCRGACGGVLLGVDSISFLDHVCFEGERSDDSVEFLEKEGVREGQYQRGRKRGWEEVGERT